MDDEVVIIDVNRPGDPDGKKLREALEAQLGYERARRLRQRWIYLSVLIVFVVGMRSIGCSPLAPSARPWGFAVAVRDIVLLRAVLAGAIEWWWHRRWMLAAAQHGRVTVLGDRDHA